MSAENTTLVLVNPTAGGGRADRRAEAALAGLDLPLDIRRTTGPGHATALAAAARGRGVRRFVAVGGDGTLHEVVNGAMAPGPGRPAVGLLPLGTGNSFGRDLGVVDVASARAALTGRCRPVDLARLDHDDGVLWSINLVGLGFTAQAGELTNRRFKRLGALGYVAAVLVEVGRLDAPVLRLRRDGGAWEAAPRVMVSVCNSRFTGGGMQMAPGAVLDDGLLDLIAVGPMSRARLLTAFPRIFSGTHTAMPEVSADRVRRIELELDGPVPVMVDGEVLRLRLRAVEVVAGAVELMCPIP